MTAKIFQLFTKVPAIDLDEETAPVTRTPESVAAAIRAHLELPEEAFDSYLPADLRAKSGQFWTPLCVVQRAAEWFSELGIRSVVDVGSGAGKFCVAMALATDAKVIALEHRERLVRASRDLAALFHVEDRIEFIHGVLDDNAPPVADAYYFYNPFGENIFGPEDHLDHDVELSFTRYRRDINIVAHLLRKLPVGAYVMTYNGYGGKVPNTYTEARIDRAQPNILRMWRKTTQ